jgi:hypothetical protein
MCAQHFEQSYVDAATHSCATSTAPSRALLASIAAAAANQKQLKQGINAGNYGTALQVPVSFVATMRALRSEKS